MTAARLTCLRRWLDDVRIQRTAAEVDERVALWRADLLAAAEHADDEDFLQQIECRITNLLDRFQEPAHDIHI